MPYIIRNNLGEIEELSNQKQYENQEWLEDNHLDYIQFVAQGYKSLSEYKKDLVGKLLNIRTEKLKTVETPLGIFDADTESLIKLEISHRHYDDLLFRFNLTTLSWKLFDNSNRDLTKEELLDIIMAIFEQEYILKSVIYPVYLSAIGQAASKDLADTIYNHFINLNVYNTIQEMSTPKQFTLTLPL